VEAFGDERHFEFVRNNLDQYVDSNGAIATYKRADYNLTTSDRQALLAVYQKTGEKIPCCGGYVEKTARGAAKDERGRVLAQEDLSLPDVADGLFMRSLSPPGMRPCLTIRKRLIYRQPVHLDRPSHL